MIGYRDDELFGDGYTDPLQVVLYECNQLGNSDVLDMMVNNPRNLDDDEVFYIDAMNSMYGMISDEIKFAEIFDKYTNGANYCKWVCDSKEQVYDRYIKNMMPVSFDQYVKKITEVEIPDDAVLLSDCGSDGKLFAWIV